MGEGGSAENAARTLVDSDITQDPEVEPSIEVIIGARVAAADGNLTHAKNPRRLHLA
jgi:hypothetical protein